MTVRKHTQESRIVLNVLIILLFIPQIFILRGGELRIIRENKSMA